MHTLTSALGSILFAFDAALVPAATPPITTILLFLLVDNYVSVEELLLYQFAPLGSKKITESHFDESFDINVKGTTPLFRDGGAALMR